jgi:hypothetical protein
VSRSEVAEEAARQAEAATSAALAEDDPSRAPAIAKACASGS